MAGRAQHRSRAAQEHIRADAAGDEKDCGHFKSRKRLQCLSDLEQRRGSMLAVRQSLIMLPHLKFELWRFSKGHWLHFLLAIPGLVLWTVLHEGAHALAVVLQGGQVTKFVWLPTRARWGYVEYNFSDPHFSEFAIAMAPYGFWLLLALMAGVLSRKNKPYSHWVASTIFIWMFVVPLGDIAMPALAYFFGSTNDFTSAFGSPTRVSSMLIVLFGIMSVVYGMIIQQRLYRERALSAIGYTLMALVALAMLGALHLT